MKQILIVIIAIAFLTACKTQKPEVKYISDTDTLILNQMTPEQVEMVQKYIIGLSDAYKKINDLEENEKNLIDQVKSKDKIIKSLERSLSKKIVIKNSFNDNDIQSIRAKLDSSENSNIIITTQKSNLEQEIKKLKQTIKDNSKVKTDNSTKVKTSKSIWMYSTIFLLLVIVSYIVFKRFKTNKA